jgi:glucan 1,3-beta-glucosidase
MTAKASSSISTSWLTWSVLILVALAGAWWWWQIGRPIELPEAPSARIACVSYAPFRRPGETPYDLKAFISPERIDADLRALSERFDCVRTYSQGQGLDAVPAIAARYHMKVLMGIWLGADPKANAREVALGIASAKAHPQVLRGVIVGNEVLLRTDLSPAALAGYLQQVRAAIPRQVPITYADVWEFWLRYPQMAKYADFITIHILPYWEDAPVPPEHAIAHLATVYAKLQQAFPDKRVMIGETGWPSAGRPRRAASASVVNEARYLREFLRYAATVNMPYNVIEAFDQPWKRAQEGTVGGYWGIFDVNARAKFPMRGPVVEEPNWADGWLAGALGVVLFIGIGLWHRRWQGLRGLGVLSLSGFASGTALAWQYRQMYYACGPLWEWALALACCALALLTALRLSQLLAARLSGGDPGHAPARWWRFGWMLALTYYDLLMVFDGRYRDFPLGLFALPCLGFALAGSLGSGAGKLLLEERFLAFWMPALAAVVVALELGLDSSTWLWLLLNLALALPVLRRWLRDRQPVGLAAQ